MVEKTVRNTALLVVALGSFLIPFMGSSLSIALPIIQRDLALDVILLGWIPTVFVLASAAFILPFGRLGDIYGIKKIFTYGVIVYTLASLLAALSPSGTFLIIFSFLQGVGCSLMFATGVALLSSVYPAGRRGEALGIYVTAVYVGLSLGPILGGFLAQNLGWRSIFLFNVPLGLILMSLIFWKLKTEWIGSAGEKFDLLGSSIYIISIIVALYGFSTVHETMGKLLLLVGLLGIILLVMMERRSPNPVIKLEIFRNRITSFSALALLLMNIAISAMWTLLSLYFQDLRYLGPQTTAIILAVQPILVALISPLVGRAADRMENRIFSVLGFGSTALGLLVLAFLDQNSLLWIPIVGLFLVGLGVAFFSSPTTNIFMGSVERKVYGMASATLSTMIYAGQTISLGILLFILANYMGNVQVTASNFPAFLLSLKTAFIVFAAVSGVGLIIVVLMGDNKAKS
jgi:EmrB/QacA subfamily drug resistance transporter